MKSKGTNHKEDNDKFNIEVNFEATDLAEGGYSTYALGHGIFTEGKDWKDLKIMVRDAVLCHFESTDIPSRVLLKHTREETIII